MVGWWDGSDQPWKLAGSCLEIEPSICLFQYLGSSDCLIVDCQTVTELIIEAPFCYIEFLGMLVQLRSRVRVMGWP